MLRGGSDPGYYVRICRSCGQRVIVELYQKSDLQFVFLGHEEPGCATFLSAPEVRVDVLTVPWPGDVA